MHNKTLSELSAGLAGGDFSSEELTGGFLARIGKFDGNLNSFIPFPADSALAQARAADARRAQG